MTVNHRAPKKRFRWSGRRASGLGIDIGSSQTKLVWLEGSARSAARVVSAMIPTECDIAFEDTAATESAAPAPQEQPKGSQEDRRASSQNPFCAPRPTTDSPAWTSDQLNRLTDRIGHAIGRVPRIRTAELNVALSMSVCDLRNVYVPPESSRQRDAVHSALQQSMGGEERRCIALLPCEKSKTKHRLFSVSEAMTWSVAKAFERQHLMPNRIDGLPWCLARASQQCTGAGPKEVAVMVDWSYARPTLAAMVDGEIDYVRCLNSGGLKDMCTPAINDWGFSEAQSSRWLQHCLRATEADSSNPFEDTWSWVQTCCSLMAEEINVAIEFIRWRNQGKQVAKVCFVGGGATAAPLMKYIQTDLCVEADSWRLEIADQNLTAEFAVAASLAMLGGAYAN